MNDYKIASGEKTRKIPPIQALIYDIVEMAHEKINQACDIINDHELEQITEPELLIIVTSNMLSNIIFNQLSNAHPDLRTAIFDQVMGGFVNSAKTIFTALEERERDNHHLN